MKTRLALGSSVLCWLVAGAAFADDPRCGGASFEGGVDIEVRPPDGATGVARNAPVIIRHVQGADLDALRAKLAGEPLAVLLREQGSGPLRVEVDSALERIDDLTLALTPTTRLAPDTEYFLRIARPGFEDAGYAELRFQTSEAVDTQPPELAAGEDGFEVSVDAIPEACGQDPGSHRLVVSVPPASDDGDDASIEYLFFLTRGAGVDGPQLRARARELGGAVRAAITLSAEEAASPVCLAVRATDTLGQASEAAPEVCFDPEQGSVFRGCALAPAGRPPSPLAVALACVVGLGRYATRRRRS